TLSLVRHSLLLASPILPESLLTITLRRSRYYCLCPSVPLSVTPSRVGIVSHGHRVASSGNSFSHGSFIKP
ncbi:hypothetical protein VIGAN_07151500, partial [Vigna angularis var. angularis]